MMIAVTLVATTLGLGAATAPEGAIVSALNACLRSPSSRSEAPSRPTEIPPGLIEESAVKVASIAGSSQSYAYTGTNPHMNSCGVALYGPVDRHLRDALVATITGNTTYPPKSAEGHDPSNTFRSTYWGNPLAPSMKGIMLVEQKPNANRPTLEIEYHSVLVQ